MSEYDIRTYGEVEGEDRSGLEDQIARRRRRVEERLREVGRVVVVLAGKGGVGKSFTAAGVAAALQATGGRVGLLDADLNGPTAARAVGAEPRPMQVTDRGVEPVEAESGLRLMSAALLQEGDVPLEWRGPESESHVWRGTQEHGMLREFLSDVRWGRLDWLVVDLPPGRARLEQLSGLLPGGAAAVAVTLPPGASRSSVERSVRLARERGLELLGVVENMSGYACPGCGTPRALFPGRAGREIAEDFRVDLLGEVPFDPEAARLADDGAVLRLLEETSAGAALREVAEAVASEAARRPADRPGERTEGRAEDRPGESVETETPEGRP